MAHAVARAGNEESFNSRVPHCIDLVNPTEPDQHVVPIAGNEQGWHRNWGEDFFAASASAHDSTGKEVAVDLGFSLSPATGLGKAPLG